MQRLRLEPDYKEKERARKRFLYKENRMQRQQHKSQLTDHEKLAKRQKMKQYMVDYRKDKREKRQISRMMEENMQLEKQLVAASKGSKWHKSYHSDDGSEDLRGIIDNHEDTI